MYSPCGSDCGWHNSYLTHSQYGEQGVFEPFAFLFLQAVQAITGYRDTTPEDFTEMVFKKIDTNHDGKIIWIFKWLFPSRYKIQMDAGSINVEESPLKILQLVFTGQVCIAVFDTICIDSFCLLIEHRCQYSIWFLRNLKFVICIMLSCLTYGNAMWASLSTKKTLWWHLVSIHSS